MDAESPERVIRDAYLTCTLDHSLDHQNRTQILYRQRHLPPVMLSINAHEKQKKVVPNVLPCAIKHNGPINTAERYWNPTSEADGTSIAYFRGRKLQGRKIALPEGYQGAVLQKTEKQVVGKPALPVPGEDDEMEEAVAVETKIMEQQNSFDEIVVWGHEAVPADDDVYVKGMQEWARFAEAVSLLTLSAVQGLADIRPRCTPLSRKHLKRLHEHPLPDLAPGYGQVIDRQRSPQSPRSR